MSYESHNSETLTANTSAFSDTTLVSSHQVTTVAGSSPTTEHTYGDGLTLDSKGQVTNQSKNHSGPTHGDRANLSRPLLNRARDIINSLMEEVDPVTIEIDFQSLRGSVLSLWETAAKASVFHQEILSILESAILSVDAPVKEQLLVFREAIADLEADPITQAHVDVIRTQFIKRGFNPLAILDCMDNVDD